MKRNVLSLVIALALCLNICPVRTLAAGDALYTETLTKDRTISSPFEVSTSFVFNTNGFALTGSHSTAILVTKTGILELSGTVHSDNGAGVEVQSGGSLTTMPGSKITGTTYAVEIASGAKKVQLSAGTYIGVCAAISTEDAGFAALLADGCAYFDESGNPIRPTDMAGVRKVTVNTCTNHSKTYVCNSGAPTHTWTCDYCKAQGTEPCTFVFDENGGGTCDQGCGNGLSINVNETALADLVYDGAVKPGDAAVTVTLNGGPTLTKNTDYTVDYEIHKDAAKITVTVTGITFNGTFTQTYTVNRSQKVLVWDTTTNPVPVSVDYDGSPVEASDLPSVKINIQSATDDLKGYLQYSYKKQNDSTYTDGLPTDAGTYDVIVSLPKTGNLEAAVSDPITLTINKIGPITTAPGAKTLTFNRAPQELVTAGTLKDVAARDGVKILFATDQAGPYSETIPAGTNAGNYEAWYKVDGTNNYNGVGPTKIDITIQRKPITPRITVTESSYVYDGAKKSPTITVEDVDGPVVIDPSQYEVTWKNGKNETVTELRTEGEYTATITSKDSGNYKFNGTATVEITPAVQNALKITNKPAHVYYGDSFTLDTTGGTGDGTVTWSVTGNATIQDTGKITVTGIGSVTVKAERTVENYGAVNDTWTFIVEPKPVTAVVTVTAKPYDGNRTASVTAAVKAGDLVNTSDSFALNGLTGTYDTANAGTGKTVTLDDTLATKKDGSGKYAVSYPATATGDINPRNVTVSVTLSGNDLKTDAGGYYYDFDGTERRPAVTVTVSGESTELAASDYTVTYANNKNVSTSTVKAAVTVTAKAGGNYTFTAVPVVFEIRSAGAVLTKAPQAKDLTYIRGTAQELVDVGTADGGTVVYSETENGSYSENIPKQENAGTYTVYYKVKGDANHSDTAPAQVSVTIKPKEFTPVITLSETSFEYDGTAKIPTSVTVKDGNDEISNTEYIVSYRDNVNAGTATAVISDNNGGNYIVNGTKTFQITKKAPTVTAPTAKTGLQYTGAEQALVNAGVCNDGTVVYSVNGGSYSAALPTASARGTYTIDWKVLGDANHSDTAPARLTDVVIAKNTVNNPDIWLSSNQFPFNNSQQKPDITVCDDSHRLIPSNEYTVTITGQKSDGTPCNNMIDVATYTVTITTPDTSNYKITGNNTRTFEIVPAGQETLSITNTRGQVYYGDVIQLGTAGGTSGGTVEWKITGNSASTLSSAGLLTVKDINVPITVTVTRSRGGNYEDISATWTFTPTRKPVTAVLTGVDKPYDAFNSANVNAAVVPGDLVSGDSITITGVTGTFDDPNVGTNKRVTVNSKNASVTGTNTDKYDITYPATATASIRAVAATVTSDPSDLSLTYDASRVQALVGAGSVTGGIMVYSLDGTNFTRTIPTAKDAGDYTVYYKAQGDSNHTDSAVQTRQVAIAQRTVTPNVELNPPSAQYTGNVQRPQVIVRDSTVLIPASEYTVVYDAGSNWKDAGNHIVTVKDVTGGNYKFDDQQATFTISKSTQSPLSITGRPARVQYGDAPFTLTAVGGSGTGGVTWSSNNSDVASIDGNGVVTVKKAGSVTITATREAAGGYDAVSVDWTFTVEQKPVSNPTVTVTQTNLKYTGQPLTPAVAVTVDGNTLGTGEYSTIYSDNTNAGTATVTVTSTNACNYKFSGSATFEIAKATPVITNPTATGTAGQTLSQLTLNATATFNGNNVNGTFVWMDSSDTVPTNGQEYKVTFTPTGSDAANYTIIEFDVTVNITASTPPADTSDTPSAEISSTPATNEVSMSMPASVKNDTASAALSTADGTKLVKAAAAKQSPNVVIKPKITENVTKAEVSIPASTVKQITDETSADLTVSTPIADTTISREALETLGQAGGTVSVAAEQADQGVTVTLTANGQQVDSVPGGLTVTVPVEETKPGTVAVLVHEDGTRETIRKSVASDGKVNIPLDGSATVEIVDNSKEFEDVSEDNWASDAVAFASAHELFNGTSETTFSPEEEASRGMLATVLYNLEGRPEQDVIMQDLDSGYSDVSGDAWYAEGVAWAAKNGIVNGYGDGQFGPDDSVTREQLAVMLWKYAGSPEAGDQALGFTDADQASEYAREALRWAVEKGILNGYGNGSLVPGGTATRAEAAQMLKNFMERA